MKYRYVLIVFAVLYGASLALPHIIFAPNSFTSYFYYGIWILLSGFLALLQGNFAWCANFVIVLAMASLSGIWSAKQNLVAMYATLIAFVVALDSYAYRTGIGGAEGEPIQVSHLGSGFYLWELSILVLAFYFYLRYRQARSSNKSPPSRHILWDFFVVVGAGTASFILLWFGLPLLSP